MAKKNIKCYYPTELFIIDIMCLMSLALIGYGIFNIYYVKTTVFEQCTLDNIDKMLIAGGSVFIVIGVVNVIECIYIHIEYIKSIKNRKDDDNTNILTNYGAHSFKYGDITVFIPAGFMLFIFIALIDFVFIGVIFYISACHNTPFYLLMVNMFVVGLLPLTLVILGLIIIAIPYGIGYLICMALMFCYTNINNICCIEIKLNNRNTHNGDQNTLPTYIEAITNYESNC